jgi:hypothetical protein
MFRIEWRSTWADEIAFYAPEQQAIYCYDGAFRVGVVRKPHSPARPRTGPEQQFKSGRFRAILLSGRGVVRAKWLDFAVRQIWFDSTGVQRKQ